MAELLDDFLTVRGTTDNEVTRNCLKRRDSFEWFAPICPGYNDFFGFNIQMLSRSATIRAFQVSSLAHTTIILCESKDD